MYALTNWVLPGDRTATDQTNQASQPLVKTPALGSRCMRLPTRGRHATPSPRLLKGGSKF